MSSGPTDSLRDVVSRHGRECPDARGSASAHASRRSAPFTRFRVAGDRDAALDAPRPRRNAASWTPVIPGLAGPHVIAIDLPGHGGSPEGPTWEFGPMARD